MSDPKDTTIHDLLAKIAEAAESKYADQPDRLIREVCLNRMHLTKYMNELNQADLFKIAACKILGIKSPANHDAILKAIEDIKTAAGVASHRAAQLTGLAIDRGDAIDRLLTVLKAPLRYDNGEPLTREERVEWAIRRATP